MADTKNMKIVAFIAFWTTARKS